MSLSRAVSSGLRCTACPAPIARALPKATPNANAARASWIPSLSLQRSISWTARRSVDRNDPAATDPEFAFLDESNKDAQAHGAPQLSSIPPEELEATPSSPFTTSEELDAASSQLLEEIPPSVTPEASQSTLPWYLQNRPAPEPQQVAILPELPPNPPPLLQTLLEYVANTAGLDDLLLYDLRHLDPPPALGSNLIMLLCTARSEKHLHVSADRFCRYLRREHRLRANAAGLLGRNELKIKLRRKAKRMKMLANVGGAEPQGNLDDGIRTGWICCTVGKIEAHPDDKGTLFGEGEGFVGFSDVKPGVNVVVQMFTEEKRAEIDLETLWGGVLKTQARNEGRAEDMLQALEEEADEANEAEAEAEVAKEQSTKETPSIPKPSPPPTFQFKRPRPSVGDVFPPAPNPNQYQQLRRLHTVGLRA